MEPTFYHFGGLNHVEYRPGRAEFSTQGGVARGDRCFGALSRFVSAQTIRSVLTQTGRHSQRIRRLPATAVVWLVIAIGIWTDLDIPAIWRQVVGTLRSLLLVMSAIHPPSKAALSQARTRLGAACLRQLFLRTAGPIALDRTRGAFYKGMRLMAIDGVRFDLPDTPLNAKAFGRPVTRRYGEPVEAGIRRFT